MILIQIFIIIIFRTINCTLNDFAKCQINNSGNNNNGLDDIACKDILKCNFNEIMING
jgi:hypothetical protein